MKHIITFGILLVLATLLVACSGSKPYHKGNLPDPSAYQAHFPDIDANGDEQVNWSEFKQYFPKADNTVFKALDMNKDSTVDHDEWHAFKAAHGLKHGH